VFETLLTFKGHKRALQDELDRFLGLEIEEAENVIAWWHEHRAMYPQLSRMALDYLTIPGKSIFITISKQAIIE
jgi:hypothetical protein